MAVKQSKRKSGTSARSRCSWSKASNSYLDLVKEFPIRPIRNDEELEDAIRMLDSLLSRRLPLNPQEQGYMGSLANEIRNYEEDFVPMPKVSGTAMLKHLIEAKNVTLSEVAAKTDIALSTLSAILAKKRVLNLTHIKALAPYFGVQPGVFI
jgi:HTH-type transcriptional regulator/antitoxin HigA